MRSLKMRSQDQCAPEKFLASSDHQTTFASTGISTAASPNAIVTSNSTETNISNALSSRFQNHHRPILVGYAFGPKKMRTMQHVMAEASMAVSTVVTQLPPHLRNASSASASAASGAQNTVEKKNGLKRKLKKLLPGVRSMSPREDSATVVTASSTSTSSAGTHSTVSNIETSATDTATSWSESSSLTPRHGHHNHDDSSFTTHSSFKRTLSRNDLEVETQSVLSSSADAYSYAGMDDNEMSSPTPKITCIFPSSFSLLSSSISLEESSLVTATTSSSSSSMMSKYQSNISKSNYANNSKLVPMRVSFVPLDLDSPLEEQHGGKFDAILHKMTEDILYKSKLSNDETDEYDKQALKRIERLTKYKETHPACCLADHPTNVQALMSRSDIANTLFECLKGVTTRSRVPVRTPRFLILEKNLGDVANQIQSASFQYPLIVKPLTAAGTKSSHKMGVLMGSRGIEKVQGPCLLQEYANHDGLLYKVYVLGNKVWVFQRPSLPNLPIGESPSSQHDGKSEGKEYVEFDSQRPYPTLDDFGISPLKASTEDGTEKVEKYQDKNKLTAAEIRPVANAIRKAFGLKLFGFDILVTEKEVFSVTESSPKPEEVRKEMLVVDVNYFPSYKEVTNFSQLLAQYLAQCGIEGRLRSFET
mmetsp:Transcript_9948/g.14995  ORF Transcript_9948/g.14995 Transcript_9948/m.14995 type:complete len:648 (+) Transcript_9948:388-2331(+)